MTANLSSLPVLAKAALSHFEISPLSTVELISLSENAIFKIVTPEQFWFAMRIHREDYHSRKAIESELAWIVALRDAGVVTPPNPLRGRDGEFIQEIYIPSLNLRRHVVLFGWEAGIQPLMSDALEKPFETLGEAAARMHIHAREWHRPEWFERFTWNFETCLGEERPHWGRWREGLGVDATRQTLFGRAATVIKQRLANYGTGPDRFGLVHGDMRLANLLIDAENVKVIDFDDCGFSWFMYDAATTVSFYEDDAKVPDLIESWLVGYRRVAQLSIDDENEIPTFIMLRRLLLVAWIGSHRETELAQDMGYKFTEVTDNLCENYLINFS